MAKETRISTVRKDDVVDLIIEDLTSEGQGVGKINGYPIFVKDALPGDRIQAKVIKAGKTYGYGRLLKFMERSKNRVEPECGIARQCGGCQLQHLSYQAQLEYKQNKVRSCLERIGGFRDIEMEPVIGMEQPFYYRNKAQFPVGRNKEGKVVTGFYAGRTHSVMETSHCYIQSEINEKILEIVRGFIEKNGISVYEETTHKGLIRHIFTRIGFVTGEIMVCLVINGRSLPEKDRLIEELCKIEGMKSICLNVNEKKTNVILGSEMIPLWGELYITDYIGKVKYQISPLSFYQVNPVQTKKLYETALQYAKLTGNEIVWDLYCGIGTISLFLAQKAKQVYGVEIVPQAIEDARNNARINGIENAKFFVGAAEEVVPEQYAESKGSMKADVIVLDPPRKGCGEELLETVAAMAPERVVYVSCDPGTLARDLRYLCDRGYEVRKVQVVDQFGHTVHVETIILMTYCGDKLKK